MPPAACHRGDVSASRRPTARTSTTVSIRAGPLPSTVAFMSGTFHRGSGVPGSVSGNVPVPITLSETTVCIRAVPLPRTTGPASVEGQTVSSTLIARRSSIAR